MTKKQLQATFGSFVKELRKTYGYSQHELAAKMGVSRNTISNLENGTTTPLLRNVEKLQEIFGNNALPALHQLYLRIQDNIAVLMEWAKKLKDNDFVFATRILKKCFRLSEQDARSQIIVAFTSILWDYQMKRKVNKRKIDFVVHNFKQIDSDTFLSLVLQLYDLCFSNGKQFEVFFQILDAIDDEVSSKNNPFKEFMLHFHSAGARYYQGEYIKALKCSEKSLSYQGIISDVYMARAFLRHGNICMQLNDLKLALESYFSAYEILKKFQNDPFLPGCLANLGRAYYQLGDYDMALSYWNQFFEKTSDDDPMRLNVLTDLTLYYIETKQISAAWHTFNLSNDILQVALSNDWSLYYVEALLHQRNHALLTYLAGEKEKSLVTLLEVSDRLMNSHLKDEFVRTNRIIVDILKKEMYNEEINDRSCME
ncbi:helix-turn-helix transcriptional regulator [Brevibacillus marinus]|uniref:helix-turn-helix transcriptional regulator n=1 Tax=Brevibacillus marinus TaxID=2496837 RepID=UPI000F818E0A|nr:helix-turn-helix transcriptional regulator [Brevibacillus marinus]